MVYVKTLKIIYAAFICSLYIIITPSQGIAAEPLKKALSNTSANVVFLRHALAPGFGDPAEFQINDCSTQRNLDQAGQRQARFIGKYLREHKIVFDTILSSQWCRCKQTADLLNMGSWQEFTGLNSFFQGHADRTDTLKKLQQKLDNLPADTLVLMITHQVTINAVTKISPASGGFVVYNSRTKVSKSVQLNIP